MSIAPVCGDGVTIASSAWKTLGPVERLEQPDDPGSQCHTPCGLAGSTATHIAVDMTPTSMGSVVAV
jgi:hypothetical protein